jgi:hypothetical protein
MSVEQYETCNENGVQYEMCGRTAPSMRRMMRMVSRMMRQNEIWCGMRRNGVTLCDEDEQTAMKDSLGSLSFCLPAVAGRVCVPSQCPVSLEAFVAGVATVFIVGLALARFAFRLMEYWDISGFSNRATRFAWL